MKMLIIVVLVVICYAWVCCKGYEDGFRNGKRHWDERIDDVRSDILHNVPIEDDIAMLLFDIPGPYLNIRFFPDTGWHYIYERDSGRIIDKWKASNE